jgi:hypothetical protein
MANPLNNLPGWQSFGDDAALLAHLLASDSRRIAADPLKMETAWAGGQRVVRDFGTEVYEQMMGVLKSVAPATGDLLATGIDFGDPKTQQMLDNLAAGAPSVFTAERIAIMRAWGIVTKPLWRWVGIEAEPTVEDIAAWRLDADTRLARDQIRQRINDVASAISQAETPEAVLADAEAAWAGGTP